MNKQTIINANLVLKDEVIKGAIVIENGHLKQIDQNYSQLAAAEDWNDDYLIPGMVELHTDNMEKFFTPRPGVIWPKVSAMIAHDRQMVGSGVTTVFDAVAVGYDIHDSQRTKILDDVIDSIAYLEDNELSKADHFIHLRCELSSETTADKFDLYAHNPRLKLVSLMDHAPGQRQFSRLDKYIEYYQKKYGHSDEQMALRLESHKASSQRWSGKHRRYIAEICRARKIPMASHDDATDEHVTEAVNYGVSIAEFPTTLKAAELSHNNDMKVLMGAPNIIRGHSHSGNVAARELAEGGYLDILSSDYYPSSLLQSAFMLADLDFGINLPEAIRCVTENPAQAVGLEHRGSIQVGYKADLLRVGKHFGLPILKETWKSGERVG
ncbi:MAG: alpha-D-ribose 1-methylphosphonate 5-triphosphate diphosphatase [Gammaproteobacteria bacterium]|jgi:alpha-D-ribose 1-methylphosphonate 5-triphosphate diphosphatase